MKKQLFKAMLIAMSISMLAGCTLNKDTAKADPSYVVETQEEKNEPSVTVKDDRTDSNKDQETENRKGNPWRDRKESKNEDKESKKDKTDAAEKQTEKTADEKTQAEETPVEVPGVGVVYIAETPAAGDQSSQPAAESTTPATESAAPATESTAPATQTAKAEPKQDEVQKSETSKVEIKKEETKKEETKKTETTKAEPKQEEVQKTETAKAEPKQEEVQKTETAKAEPKQEETQKAEEPKVEEPKAEEPKVEEPKVEEPKAEEPKVEEPKVEEPKVEEPQAEEPQVEEPKAEEPKVEEPKIEEPKVEEPKAEEPKAEEPKVEEPQAEEPKAEEPKAEEPKVEEPKAEEPKAEEPQAEEPQVEAPHEHTWDAGTVSTAATYTSKGQKTYTCTSCGEIKTEEIPELICTNHAWNGGTVTTPATYTSKGQKTYTCTNCGETKTEDIPELVCTNHAWNGGTVTIPATYTTKGQKTYTCTNCGETKTEEIPKLECKHTGAKRFDEKEAATCKDPAKGDLYCAKCGELVSKGIYLGDKDPDNHVDYHTEEKAANYKEAGYTKEYCNGCHYYHEEEIAKLENCPHDHKCVKYKDDASWSYCEDCGEYLEKVNGTAIACRHAGYDKVEVVRVPATETQWGEIDYVCSNCGAVRETKKVHPYKTYTVTMPNGTTQTVYGWFDNEYAGSEYAMEVLAQENAYRKENGLNELKYNSSLQWASNQRALEASVCWGHNRPDGTKWNTVTSEWKYGGENLASGHRTPSDAMTGWKNSEGHNKNLLYGKNSGETPFKGMSVGVFHKYTFNSTLRPSVPTETITWAQNFTFYEY